MKSGVVVYFGHNSKQYPCGYCKSSKPEAATYGLWAHKLTALQFQDLIDRCWQRSGKYCYRPIMNKTCCPSYIIRCDALNFKLSRSQKKAIKKFHDYIDFGIVPKSYDKNRKFTDNQEILSSEPVSCEDSYQRLNLEESKQESRTCPSSFDEQKPREQIKKARRSSSLNVSNVNISKADNDVGKDKSRKAKYLRIKRRITKIMSQYNCCEEEAVQIMKDKRQEKLDRLTKSYEDYFRRPMVEKPVHQLEIRFVSAISNEYQETFEETFKLYKKYQTKIHKDDPSECTRKQFKRFLIDNPFEELEPFSNKSVIYPTSYGSYHMQYWLDGKLIAVAVLDLLPRSLSSVYLFYDPDLSFLNLGTYSALREILLVKYLNKLNLRIVHYYLGLYINSCPKMNYKGNFYPSYLLCEQALTWHPLEKCLPKFEKSSYPRLEDNLNIHDADALVQDEDILILCRQRGMVLPQYKLLYNADDVEEIYEYARLVGRKCVRTIYLYRRD